MENVSIYKKEFKLNIDLVFDMEHTNTCYRWDDYINISGEEIGRSYYGNKDRDRHKYNSIRELSIIYLLHEIGHAIDYKRNKQEYKRLHARFLKQVATSTFKGKYHHFILEQKADFFANNEKKKWV